jgi:hypothetical protein
MIKRLTQGLRLHDVRVQLGTVADWANAAGEAVAIDVHDELKPKLGGTTVPERDHVAKLPGGVNVQQRKRRLARIERLQRQVQQNRRVLADGIEQHRIVALRDGLPNDVNALGLQGIEMSELIGTAVMGGRRTRLLDSVERHRDDVHGCVPAIKIGFMRGRAAKGCRRGGRADRIPFWLPVPTTSGRCARVHRV